MNALINKPDKPYWSEVHKQVYFVLHEYEEEWKGIIDSINEILLKVGNIFPSIPIVQI